jgi:hypothetical protein
VANQTIGAFLRRLCGASGIRLVTSAKPVEAASAPVEIWQITGRNAKNNLTTGKFLTNWNSAPLIHKKP